jgi:hypothetical protein
VPKGGSAFCNIPLSLASPCTLHLLLQGHNFSLVPEDTVSPPVDGFGLLLNGCYLPEYYLPAAPTASLNHSAASRWNLTIAPFLSGSSAMPLEINGWWVVPAHDHGESAANGWRLEVADMEESKKCLGSSCGLWRLAAAASTVTMWSGHLHIASGTRPPTEIRNSRWLYDLRVRHFLSDPFSFLGILALCWSCSYSELGAARPCIHLSREGEMGGEANPAVHISNEICRKPAVVRR